MKLNFFSTVDSTTKYAGPAFSFHAVITIYCVLKKNSFVAETLDKKPVVVR